MDDHGAGQGYLDHLTDRDLRLLASVGGMDPERAGELRARPAVVLELADRPELFERVYGQIGGSAPPPEPVVTISPFLAFLAAVGQARREIADTPYVP